jgi:hypothetical protein
MRLETLHDILWDFLQELNSPCNTEGKCSSDCRYATPSRGACLHERIDALRKEIAYNWCNFEERPYAS